MPFLKVGVENTSDIHLYYEDLGSGRSVILVHGWPLNGASWERQTSALLAAGYRVITYDRRGFGRSDKPSDGYDYNTLTADLAKLIEALDLRDAILVGFSMGGGEVARYLGKYGDDRISKACFMSSIVPALKKTAENPEGVDPAIFETMKKNIIADRFAFLGKWVHQFYNESLISGTDVSDEVLQHTANVAACSSYGAMLFCIDAWLEDFRDDLATIKIHILVIHGDADKVLPIESTGERTAKFIPGAEYHVVEGGPHGINWTHATEVNTELLRFLKA
jgi:non-heme chloroperoxidase